MYVVLFLVLVIVIWAVWMIWQQNNANSQPQPHPHPHPHPEPTPHRLDLIWELDTSALLKPQERTRNPETGGYWTRKFKLYDYKTGRRVGTAFLDTTNVLVSNGVREAYSRGILRLEHGTMQWLALSRTSANLPNAFSGAELLSGHGWTQGLDGKYLGSSGVSDYDEQNRLAINKFRIPIDFV